MRDGSRRSGFMRNAVSLLLTVVVSLSLSGFGASSEAKWFQKAADQGDKESVLLLVRTLPPEVMKKQEEMNKEEKETLAQAKAAEERGDIRGDIAGAIELYQKLAHL